MGIVIAIFAACFQSAKDLVSKRLSFTVGITVSAFASFAYAMPFYLVLLSVLWLLGYEDFRFTGLFLQYVVLRSITDIGAEWCKMASLRHGEISLVAPFFSLSPLFLLFVSPLLTGDRIPLLGNIAVVVVVLGTALTAFEPKETAQAAKARWKAIALALLSAFFFSLNTSFDRLAVLNATPWLSGMAMTFLSGFILLPFVLPYRAPRAELTAHHRPFLVRGVFEAVSMVLKLWALQYLPAPYVASIQRLSMLFSIIGGRLLYSERHFGRRILGATVILFGVVLIFLAELQ